MVEWAPVLKNLSTRGCRGCYQKRACASRGNQQHPDFKYIFTWKTI